MSNFTNTKPPSSKPMPYLELQNAAIKHDIKIKWEHDLYGCRPVAVSPAGEHASFQFIGNYTPAGQMANANAAMVPRGFGTAAMHTAAIHTASSSQGSVNTPGEAQYGPSEIKRDDSEKDAPGTAALIMDGLKLQIFPPRIPTNLPSGGFFPNAREVQLQVHRAEQVHAVSFPAFRNLAPEVKIMIWGSALSTFVEVITNQHRNQFLAPGPRDAIFALCGDYKTMFYMTPIFFYRHNSGQSFPDVVYIRPAVDTVYIGCEALIDLDIASFCADPANQVIENLALSAVSAGALRWCGLKLGRGVGTRSWVGDLVRGLRNLKKLYVVEGERLHKESDVQLWRRGRPIRYEVTLKDVPTRTNLPLYDHRGRFFLSPPAKPWTVNIAETIIKKLDEEIEREKSGEHEMYWTGSWSRPEVICKFLVRRELHWVRRKKHPASAFTFSPLPLHTFSPLPVQSPFFDPVMSRDHPDEFRMDGIEHGSEDDESEDDDLTVEMDVDSADD